MNENTSIDDKSTINLSVSKEQMDNDIAVILKKTDKNEKLAWSRKNKKMEKFLEDLRPIEDQFLDLLNKKQPIMDQIAILREIMIRECIHPIDNLVHHGSHVECKFCDTLIKVNRTL